MSTPVAPARLAADNGITAMRLILALWVLALHSFPLAGRADPVGAALPGDFGGAEPAVWVFFALSGYLLVQSRQRLSVGRFVLRRFLRLVPGYWVNILVTALVVGPWYIGAAWNPAAWQAMPAAFHANPLPAVNGSLWTLSAEIACYAVLTIAPRFAVPSLLLFTLVVPPMWRPLVIAFAIGSFAGGRVTVRLPLPTLRADLSYGVYIYAFPVAQVLVMFGLRDPLPLMLAAAAITLPIAAASWFLVERPAIALGHRQRLEHAGDVRALGAVGALEAPLVR